MPVVWLALLVASTLWGVGRGDGGLGRDPSLAQEVPKRVAASRPSPQSQVPRPQSPIPSPQRPVPGSDLTIYLMTMGSGDQIWERFGHNAIRIVDATRGTDSVYNWGTFDFHQPHFLQRFMTGNTLYWMQGDDIAETLATYRYLNRSVWVQELDLTPAQRAAVRDFIAWNALPDNRYYRYDYYLDNCSTRVRDVIDRIVGGQLKAAISPRLTNTTYRFHTQRALQFDEPVALGTNVGLGEVADRRITAWEESFLPARLQDHVRSVHVRAPDGSIHPLVKNEQQLFAANRPPEPTAPPHEMGRNLLIGVVIAGVIASLALAARSGRRSARIAFSTLATIWTALNGILGVILIVGWTATRHVFMARNENLLQFDPLALVLAVVLPLAVARGRAVGAARSLSLAILIVALLGLAIKLLPWFDQVNGEVIALTLPAHFAIAWAVLSLTVAPDPVSKRAAAMKPAAVSRSAA